MNVHYKPMFIFNHKNRINKIEIEIVFNHFKLKKFKFNFCNYFYDLLEFNSFKNLKEQIQWANGLFGSGNTLKSSIINYDIEPKYFKS